MCENIENTKFANSYCAKTVLPAIEDVKIYIFYSFFIFANLWFYKS